MIGVIEEVGEVEEGIICISPQVTQVVASWQTARIQERHRQVVQSVQASSGFATMLFLNFIFFSITSLRAALGSKMI